MSVTTTTGTASSRPTLLVRLADWSYRRRRRVLLLWIVLLVATVFGAGALGGSYHFTFSTPGSDSQKAQDMLKKGFPARAGDDVNVVFRTQPGKTVDDPVVHAAIAGILDQFGRQPHVRAVVSPFSPEGARQIAPRRSIAYGTLRLDQTVSDYKTADAKGLIDLGKKVDRPDLQVELAGFALGG